MENQEPQPGWGDLKKLKDGESHPQKKVQSIVVAGEMEDCFLLEMVIKHIDPSIKVIPFTNADDLLLLLETYLPDLLIMDLEMPCERGADCLRMIREDACCKDLKIIVFSRSSRPSNRTIALELGGNGFLEMVKPLQTIKKQIEAIIKDV